MDNDTYEHDDVEWTTKLLIGGIIGAGFILFVCVVFCVMYGLCRIIF